MSSIGMYEDQAMPNKFSSKTLMERDQMVDQELGGKIIIIINSLIKTYQQVPTFHQLNKKEDCAMWSVTFINLVVINV